MKITTMPKQFAPAFKPLIYGVKTEGERGMIEVEVADDAAGETLGMKRFAEADEVNVNVAGYVRRRLKPQPQNPRTDNGEGFRFLRDAGRQVAITVKAGDAVAEARVFTCATDDVAEFDTLSRMPADRMLAEGEWDEISLAVPDTVLSARMRVTGEGVDFTLTADDFTAECGVATLVVDAAAIADAARANYKEWADCERADVKIYANDELIAGVAYGLYSRSPGQRRIGWLNSLGGIDYHTFHAVEREGLAVERQRIFSGGQYCTVASVAERSAEIVSGYCARPLSDALMEIVSSPMVWMVGVGGAVPIDVVTDKVEVLGGELFSLRLNVNYESRIRNYE
jgi:hypothetical protein